MKRAQDDWPLITAPLVQINFPTGDIHATVLEIVASQIRRDRNARRFRQRHYPIRIRRLS
jgi:hypothetical protein